jgi:RNA polymerase sigma factor FliA
MNSSFSPFELQSQTPAPLPPRQTELWHRYHRQGPGDSSENDLIKSYLSLVKTVIGRLAISLPPHVDMEDLYSAGLVGLLNAVRNFDAKRGTAFEPYARMRIRGAALDELRRMDWVPRSVHAKAKKVQAVMSGQESQRGRLPTDREMAEAMQMSLREYENLLDEIRPATFICLDASRSAQSQEGGPDQEVLAGEPGDNPANKVSNRELAEVIQIRIKELPETHRKVLAFYYYEDLRLREIAELCGLCESRICQIHTQSILAIRSFLEQYETSRHHAARDLAA